MSILGTKTLFEYDGHVSPVYDLGQIFCHLHKRGECPRVPIISSDFFLVGGRGVSAPGGLQPDKAEGMLGEMNAHV